MGIVKKRYILLLVISISAFYIRFLGIRFGFPLLTHPDEPQLIFRGLKILQTNDFNPHFFNYPSLYIYFQSMVYLIVQKFCILLKIHQTIENIPITTIVFWGRFLTVCLSVATILVTYHVGTNLFNKKVGLLSTLFLSFSYLHITNSYLITVDSPMALWVLLSFYFSILIYKNNKLSNYILGGFFVGFAVGTKYNAFFCAVPIAVAHFNSIGLSFKNIFNRRLIIAVITALLVFFISTPYSLLDFHSFISDLSYESSHYKIGHLGADQGSSYLFYITSMIDGFGIIPILLSMLGMVVMCRKGKDAFILLISFPLFYFVFVGYYKVHFERNIVVLMPFLSFFSGYAIWTLLNLSEGKEKKTLSLYYKIINSITVMLIIVSLFFQAHKSLNHILTITLPDTKYISGLWVKENLPEHSKIAREHFTYLPENGYVKDFPLGVSGVLFFDLSYFDYFITSSPNYLPLFNDIKNFPKATELYKNIFRENTLIKEFLPDNKTITGPQIGIYKVNKLVSSEPQEGRKDIHIEIGEIKEIVREVQKTAFVNIDLSELYCMLGDLFNKNGEKESAIDHYQIALKIQPRLKKAIEKIGLVYASQGNYKKSLHYFNNLVLLEPENAKLYYNIACILSIQNRVQDSIEALQIAVLKGYQNIEQIEKDEDLNNIRTDKRYKDLIQNFKHK